MPCGGLATASRRTDLADTDSRFRAEAVDREVLRINGEFQDGLSAGAQEMGVTESSGGKGG